MNQNELTLIMVQKAIKQMRHQYQVNQAAAERDPIKDTFSLK
jgi:hypothetical protein